MLRPDYGGSCEPPTAPAHGAPNRNITDNSFDPLLNIAGVVRANEDTPATHIYSTSTYDQVFPSTEETTKWTGAATLIRFDEIFFGNDDSAANLAASDHRPVWVSLLIPDTDED